MTTENPDWGALVAAVRVYWPRGEPYTTENLTIALRERDACIGRKIAAALEAQAEYDWNSSPNLSAEDSRRWHAERDATTARAFEGTP